jgi:hypothetical protein
MLFGIACQDFLLLFFRKNGVPILSVLLVFNGKWSWFRSLAVHNQAFIMVGKKVTMSIHLEKSGMKT